MGQDSKIEWTDHTFNPWWGCTHVHEGCRNCYAETHAETEDFGIEIGAFGAVANIYCRLMGLEPSSEEQIRNVTTNHG